QGFDPADGRRLWTAFSPGEGVVPSPVHGDGLVFWGTGFGSPAFRAVRLGGSGDVTRTHSAWAQRKAVSMIPSAGYVEPHLFAVTDKGIAAGLEAATGKVVWQERVGGPHSASPVYADGKIYFLSEEGETTIIEAGPAFKVVARSGVGEPCQASMAVS